MIVKLIAKEFLMELHDSSLFKRIKKTSAIMAIKNQPFFGLRIPKNCSKFVKFRRPRQDI